MTIIMPKRHKLDSSEVFRLIVEHNSIQNVEQVSKLNKIYVLI